MTSEIIPSAASGHDHVELHPPGDVDKFRKWFEGKVIASGIFEKCDVPQDIRAMPCGCIMKGENVTTPWSIEGEPLEQFAAFHTSMVMIHSGCRRSVGEIITPWAVL